MNSEVDKFYQSAKNWKDEMVLLRFILKSTKLNEKLKWKQPCYTYDNNNILIIGAFKKYCVLSFFKGVLLKDPHQLLVSPGANSQSTRQFQFTDVESIKKLEPIIKQYINEAITIEKAGFKVQFKSNSELKLVAEFEEILKNDVKLKTAFFKLTPGRQRAYHLHFSSAKQSKTRISRIENCIPKILEGVGFNDCTCGLSKKLPYCDGSHKQSK